MNGRAAIALAVLIGCGPQITLDDESGSGTGGVSSTGGGASSLSSTAPSPSTSGPPPGTTVAPDPTLVTTGRDSTDDNGEVDIGGFIDDGFGDAGCFDEPPQGTSFHCTYECDLFAQDCPAGEKCVPWSNDGGPFWNATRCSPIDPAPGQVGDPCLVEGNAVSGIDNCDLGLMCLHVDSATNEGVCVAMCSGSADMPICEDEATQCMIRYDGAIALCVDTCDPLANDCTIGDCIPIDAGQLGAVGFGCFVDSADALPGAPCERAGGCESGATCNFGSPECPDEVGCCASYCDLDAPEPDAPCLLGQVCTQIFSPTDAGPEISHFGQCMAP